MNAFKHKMSLRTKLILVMLALLFFIMIMFWFMNLVFLPKFYRHQKITEIEDSFDMANKLINKDDGYKEDDDEMSANTVIDLDKLAADHSNSIYVFDLMNFFGELYYTFDYPKEQMTSMEFKKRIENRCKYYVLGIDNEFDRFAIQDELIKQEKKYAVYKMEDERIGSDYIELFGQLDAGEYIYIRTNYQSMTENVKIFNKFLIYVALGSLIIGIILMIYVGNSFTKPILRITEIAREMADLNFDVKYEGKSKDEIGLLGNSINALSENLEKTIAELKSANNELQKDIEKKIQIDEVRKEFLSNVSHELKTPIALIQGYAEGLLDNIDDDDVESRNFYCEVIVDEANKMNKMVKMLLDLNQIEFGTNQLNFEHFDLVQVIRSVINSTMLLADQKDATIDFSEEEAIYVWADEYLVEEVVTNYVSNAINHVDGRKKIEVSIKKNEDTVHVSVFNTGNPIPEDELDKVWIKFYKVDKARTREYGGSGIGLSIVKAIMDNMNQTYGVFNHKDGVEFWFELDRKSH